MWSTKPEAFENADVIRLFFACADDYCSVSSVDGENTAKTIVWTDTFLVKTEPFENGAKRKRISVDRPKSYVCTTVEKDLKVRTTLYSIINSTT